MKIVLTDTISARYIQVNPVTNRVHLLVPLIDSEVMNASSTHQLTLEVDSFFNGGAINELEEYQSVLELHAALLEEGDPRHLVKKDRLAQINIYLDALRGDSRDNPLSYNNQEKCDASTTLIPVNKEAVQQQVKIAYDTVTGTKENSHVDNFMILTREALGENAILLTQKGLICTNFSNIVPAIGPNHEYFTEVREEAATHPNFIIPQDEPVITVDIEPELLLDKLEHIHWDRLPKEVVNTCRALLAFQIHQFPDDVAKGKQDEAETWLHTADNKQFLLRTPANFTDYSGRAFNCTAYEYAYWAKDTHMCRMLERHMDDGTKALLLDKVNQMEQVGLAYQQHEVAYKNPHYGMSFVLKKLTPNEFRQLKTILALTIPKIQEATVDNYHNLAFTADEHEALKKALKPPKRWKIASLFYTSTPNAINIKNKLQFDFHSLITALDTYVTLFDRRHVRQLEAAWMSVGKAQRDVPAHVANEYCRRDRSFEPLPSFNENTLPRVLSFDTYVTNDIYWFPLSSSSSGLGFDFGLIRQDRAACSADGWTLLFEIPVFPNDYIAAKDLTAIRHLEEVRINDLQQLRESLNQLGMVH